MKKLLTFFFLALLAYSVGWAAEVTDVLNQSFTEVTGTSYTGFTGKTGSSGAVYAGQCAGGNSSIQLRSSNNNSGIVTTTSAGKVKSITVVWQNSTQNGRTLNVYGKNSAYSAATDLYNTSNQGTLLGTIVKGTSTSLTINGDYEYIGFRSASGAMYLTSVSIVWETGGGSTTPTVATIADAYAVPQGSNFIFTGNAVVTYQYGRNVWIRDNSGSGLIYRKSGETSTLNNGDILDANWSATNTLYSTIIPEFTNPTGVASSSNGGTVAPIDRTATGITTANVNEYVSFNNVSLLWDDDLGYCYYTVGNNRIYFRNNYFNNGLSVTSGNTYSIEGIAYIENSTKGNIPIVYLTKVTATAPILTVSPQSLTINDSGTNNTLTINGENISGSINAALASNTDWYLTPNTFSNTGGTTTVEYTGRALSASNTVNVSASGATTVSVPVDYVADLYIVTDNGVTNSWDFYNGTQMTNSNGVYTASFTATSPNTYILFARKLGNGVTWNTRYVFGPNSSGDWVWGTYTGGNIDLNDDDPIRLPEAGTYIITINANAGTFNITKEAQSTGDFVLVTDASQLTAGNEVIIVNSGSAGSAVAMSTTQNSNNRGETDVTVTSSLKVAAGNDVQIFTLEGDATNGWYFNTGDGYIYAASNGSNYLRTAPLTTAGDNAKASISISSGDDKIASIQFQGTNTRNVLQHNSSSHIFSCYGSASQKPVYLYQRTASIEPVITVDPDALELVIPAGGTSQSGTVTVTETNTTGTTSVSVSGTNASDFSASLDNGTLTVTYNGTASADAPAQATVTLTNGTATATVTVSGYRLPITVTITPADGHTFQGSTVNGMIESNVEGATIEYSLDGITWQTYNAEQGFTATVGTVGGTVTVYARATASNGQTATTQVTYTRVPKSTTCTADIVFAPTSDNGGVTTWSTLQGHISEGADYVYSASMATIFTNVANSAMRFGSNSNTGYLDMTLNLSQFEGGACKVARVIVNARPYSGGTSYDSDCQLNVSTSANTAGVTLDITGTTFADYVFNFDGSEITSLKIANMAVGSRVFVHSITIEYNCGASIEAPVIAPATGTYYEDQTVTITDATSGSTIYYTTDGSDPTPNSTPYSGSFVVPYTSGGSTTVKAIAVVTEDGEQQISDVASETYTWGTPSVVISPDSRNVNTAQVSVAMTATPAGATIYYTTDGSQPTTSSEQYNGAFTVELPNVGDQVTVKAIAVVGTHEMSSEVASATYTRVEKVIEVNKPFFSPLADHTYYGDQTLEIGCTTPNADIYYIIEEYDFAGNPTKSSTYYEGQTINMTVGHTYYVKAIAYIGNFASEVSSGWYEIRPFEGGTHVYQNLKDFNDNCPTGVTAHLLNPVQVVYHSTYTNNGEFAEYCYLRDNTDYACVYFGKRDNSGKTIFKMGDWIDGSQIAGVTNIWERNFHIQLGTSSHEVTSWPSQAIGWSEILPEEITNAVIVAGTAEGSNSWGHYVHLRNTRLSGVTDYSDNDPKHTGLINDGTADAYYYDKFYRWSAGTCSYNGHNDQINCLGDYDQAFFTAKQQAGATFDVYGIVDYYSLYTPPFEICPIDFLWTYKPVINPTTTTSYVPVTVNITATQPEWAAEDVVIYYKTDDMEEWAVYTGPITVNSTTTVQAYAEVLAEKTDGTNYNDYVRSEIVTETYTIEGIEDPTISPESRIIPVVTGLETQIVTITDHNDPESGAVTTYTVNGVEYTIEAGQSVNITVSETTTVTAVSSIVKDGHTMYSNEASETYTFARSNGIEYNLLKTAPVVGNIYVIVSKAANMGMSNTQNDANRGAVGVLFKENTNKETVYGNDDIAQFVLEQVSENRYYFKSLTGDGGYLCVETNEFANLVTTPAHDASGYDVATVTIGGNNSDVDLSYPATITFTYEGKVHTMRYYANNRTFSTYIDGNLNEPVFLYGAQVTPLHVIERDFPTSTETQVTVSDRLIGVWAAKNILWAKDQNYASIDATSKRNNQLDYVRMAKLKSTERAFQQDEWDQSNWVMLDFTNTGEDPANYVGFELQNNSVVGYYVDDLNYRIELMHTPVKVSNKALQGYPGFTGDAVDLNDRYILNHYVTSNFYEPNLNWGSNNGYWFEGEYNGKTLDTCLFFMNPKIQEIAQVWAVWNADMHQFTIYQKEGFDVNGYDLDGAFTMTADTWQYNRRTTASGLNDEQLYGSVEDDLQDDAYYMFHVAVMRDNYNYGHRKAGSQYMSKRNAAAKDSQATSGSIKVYPLDITTDEAKDPPTGIREILDLSSKTVESVRYYNILGMESKEPFEGINIVVTRYTDGTISSTKVLR